MCLCSIIFFNMKMRHCLLFVLALSCLSVGDAFRFLVVFPMPSKSHNILGSGYVNHLLDAGHEVVFVTSFPKERLRPNLTEVNISSVVQQLIQSNSGAPVLKNLLASKDNFADSSTFLIWAARFSRMVLENEHMSRLLNDPIQKFDAVIAEWFFSELLAGLAPLFECPLIWSGSTEAHWQISRLVDEVMSPAHSVDIFSTNTLPLSFTGRLDELWRIVKKLFHIQFTVAPMERAAYNEVLLPIASRRGVNMPTYEAAAHNASLLLLNSHPSLGVPYRLPQNAKHIGGYHLNTKVEALPQDLQEIMDGAKDGVIYFSMGSNLKSKDMSQEMKDSLLKMFGGLKQVVLWKFEENLENKPKNVHFLEWAPQQSILAHANLKLFITHGGQLSTTEAIHFGVPLIGLPVYGDQFVNMHVAATKGFAVAVQIDDNIADLLRSAIQQVLTKSSYKEKAMRLSAIYHDRPVPPGRELVHWVEHVVRTGGAPHLRSPALMVPWYQKMYLDLAALVLVILYAGCKVCKLLCNKKKSVKSSTKKND